MSSDTARAAWIVLGGIHLLNQTASRRPDDPIVLVRVTPQEVSLPSTSVVVRWDTLATCPTTALTAAGGRLADAWIEGGDLFPDATAGTALREIVGTAAAPGLVPLCYLADGPVEALLWLDPVLTAHAESALRLNNHLRYFRTHFAGTELEYKYNLQPAPDIWPVSMELLKALRHGELADCRPEYRNEFQIHYFDNHMFDVAGPDEERGYASFIPTVNGTHVLKRKWFAEDTFARREQISTDIEISPDSFGAYLRSELGLQVQALPPFRRVRYDIQCESMRTGHVFGIFFDRCSLLAAPDVVLSQCEMEYRRSRSLLDHDEEAVLREMERIDRWLLSYLAARGLAKERTFYSKLSFLRDAVAARPELMPTR